MFKYSSKRGTLYFFILFDVSYGDLAVMVEQYEISAFFFFQFLDEKY